MADAKKCDVCGNYYSIYDNYNFTEINNTALKVHIIVNVGEPGCERGNDVCKSCLHSALKSIAKEIEGELK